MPDDLPTGHGNGPAARTVRACLSCRATLAAIGAAVTGQPIPSRGEVEAAHNEACLLAAHVGLLVAEPRERTW